MAANTTGTDNTATGRNALWSNKIGNNNTATGRDALFSNTASGNTANGAFALKANTTGTSNTANGASALATNTTGQNNTAIGAQTLRSSLTGNNNIAIGVTALDINQNGSSNVAIGLAALQSTGGTGSGGNNNTAIGQQAGALNISGSGNVFLGFEAGFNGGTSNKLYIANNRTSTLIYGDFLNVKVGIGTTAPTAMLSVAGPANNTTGVWAVFSDERLKDITGNYSTGLDALMKLQPIRYHYKRDNALSLPYKPAHIGFSAQALQTVIPEAVSMTSAGYLEVDSGPVYWTMLNAIKELKQQKDSDIAKLEADKDAQISALIAKNIALKIRMDNLDSKVEMLVRAMAAGQMAQLQKTDNQMRQ